MVSVIYNIQMVFKKMYHIEKQMLCCIALMLRDAFNENLQEVAF